MFDIIKMGQNSKGDTFQLRKYAPDMNLSDGQTDYPHVVVCMGHDGIPDWSADFTCPNEAKLRFEQFIEK